MSVVVTLLALGGTNAVHTTIVDAAPELLTLGAPSGLEFGAYVVVAIVGAEMLNQAWWQRVYAASDEETLRRSFLVAAVAVVPMVFLAGIFGPVAVGLGLVEAPADASVAFFLVVTEVLPDPAIVAVAILAVLLVVSSADTLFNAIASVVTVDLPRVTDLSDEGLTTAARAVTVVVAAAATVVGAQGYSVLTLFLLADLLADLLHRVVGALGINTLCEISRSGVAEHLLILRGFPFEILVYLLHDLAFLFGLLACSFGLLLRRFCLFTGRFGLVDALTQRRSHPVERLVQRPDFVGA